MPNKKPFTLIELIVVIAIIAILGIAAFLVVTKWIGKSRDARRMSDISIIKRGLEVNILENERLPIPDPINGSNVLTGFISNKDYIYVGLFGKNTVSELKTFGKLPKDPNGNYYMYGINSNKKKYNVATTLENQSVISSLSNKLYADYPLAKVDGNYGYKEIYHYNESEKLVVGIPSLLFTGINSGTGVDLTKKPGLYYIVDGGRNLPYGLLSKEGLYKEDVVTSLKRINNRNEINDFVVDISDKLNGELSGEQIVQDMTGIVGQKEHIKSVLNQVNKLENIKIETKIIDDIVLASTPFEPTNITVSENMSDNEDTNTQEEPEISYSSCGEIEHLGFKSFYSSSTVPHGTSCDTVKAQFQCNDGNWVHETENKIDYINESCDVLGDENPPIGGDFNINGGDSSTSSINVTLNIVNPSDPEGSNPIEVAFGNSTNPTNWQIITGSKSHSLTSGDGLKTVYMKFRDSVGNETSEISKTINLDTSISGECTGIPTDAQYYNGMTTYSLSSVPNGTSFTASYDPTPDENTCEFKCNLNYSWDGSSSCVDSTPPTINSITTNSPVCNTVRFTISASDSIGLNSQPYSFDGGSTWQAESYKDYSGTTVNKPSSDFVVRDLLGNQTVYNQAVNGSSNVCIETPTNLIAVEIRYNSVYFTYDTVDTATQYEIYLGANLLGSTTNNAININGLNPNTEYTFYVKAKNTSYVSELSSPLTVTTSNLTTPILSYNNLSNTTTTLEWNAIPGASSYQVFVGNSLLGSTSKNSVYVLGLVQNSTYNFIVRVVSADGKYSENSSPLTLTTGQTILSAPSGLTLTNTTSNSVSLSWNSVSGASSYYIYKEFDGYLGRNGYLGETSGNTVNINGLQPGTQYRFSVLPYNGSNGFGTRTEITVTTAN